MAEGDDCDDTRPDVNPSAEEWCDEADNDCDDIIDEGVTTTYYLDHDEDGVPREDITLEACARPDGYMSPPADGLWDCDDTDPGRSPREVEVCDDKDNDCDEVIDPVDTIDCTEWFIDLDGDGYGTTDSICACEGTGHYTTDRLGDCDDDDASTSPDFGNCGLMGDVDASMATAVWKGATYGEEDWFNSAGAAGDLNGDGQHDVYVADTHVDTTYVDAGAIYVYFGPVVGGHRLGVTHTADVVITGDELEHFAGRGVAAGDYNGDGYGDLLISAIGKAGLFLGPLGGSYTLDDADSFVEDTYMSLLGVADTDGDGALNTYFSQSRTVYMFDGALEGTLAMTDAECSPGSPSGGWERQFSTGDVNGDGVLEVAHTSSFTVSIMAGTGCGVEVVEASISSEYAVIGDISGDLNGDGHTDLVVGAYGHHVWDEFTGYTNYAGSVFVFTNLNTKGDGWLSTATADDADTSIAGTVEYEFFGWDVGSLGDVNGDGFDDIGVTNYRDSRSGAVLFYGPIAAGTHAPGDAVVQFTDPWDTAIARPVGDHNGDGYADFLVGNPHARSPSRGGTLYLYQGATN